MENTHIEGTVFQRYIIFILYLPTNIDMLKLSKAYSIFHMYYDYKHINVSIFLKLLEEKGVI